MIGGHHLTLETPMSTDRYHSNIKTKAKCERRVQLPDQSEGIPDVNVAIHQPASNEAERESVGAGTVLPPREAVEAVGARALGDERKFRIVGLKIELEYLEICG